MALGIPPWMRGGRSVRLVEDRTGSGWSSVAPPGRCTRRAVCVVYLYDG
ncbi:hypothetical protein ABH933_000462 [Nocardia sp. GP40]